MAEPVFCEDCDHVESVSRKRDPNYWLCNKTPRHVFPGYVVRNTWTNGEPLQRCKYVNTEGNCELFDPLKTPTPEK